jgi:hypothetical protein
MVHSFLKCSNKICFWCLIYTLRELIHSHNLDYNGRVQTIRAQGKFGKHLSLPSYAVFPIPSHPTNFNFSFHLTYKDYPMHEWSFTLFSCTSLNIFIEEHLYTCPLPAFH